MTRMDGSELRMVREHLGLTSEALASMLSVRPDTVRRWESGRDPIPLRVPEEVEEIQEWTIDVVGKLVGALHDMRDPTVAVYRSDADMRADRPDTAHLPARWWRHVVARACHEVPAVKIITWKAGVNSTADGIDRVILPSFPRTRG